MKLAWIIFGSVMSFLVIFAVWQQKNIRNEDISSNAPQLYDEKTFPRQHKNAEVGVPGPEQTLTHSNSGKTMPAYTGTISKQALPDSIITYGLNLMGSPYLTSGITSNGFDCSGFIHHIYNKYGIDLPHSSALLAEKGEPVALNEVKKGDLLIFTGTTVSDRTPGHVGVVITDYSQPIEFVHASSEGGVKISKIAGTGYENRFLQARRVL